jgi:hypothetical protein
MINKNYLIVLFILAVLIILFFNRGIQTGFFYKSSLSEEKEVKTAFKNLVNEKKDRYLDFKNNNSCYWIRSTVNETNYLLEITEYETSANAKGCTGLPKETNYIVVDKPVNLNGEDCVCGNLKYLLKLTDLDKTNQLEISRG